VAGDQHRHLLAARAQLAHDLERLGAASRAQDAVALAEAHAQVARDRRQHGGLVVDRQDREPSRLRSRCVGDRGRLLGLRGHGAPDSSRSREEIQASAGALTRALTYRSRRCPCVA
jgi:hypothetical protein